MNKRFVITESQKKEIRKMYGLITEDNDIISQYVNDPRLQNILEEIESEFGEKFTKEHFEKEISISGEIKAEAGELLPEAKTAFEKMKNQSGCNDIFIKEVDDKDQTLSVSYRTYDDQKRRFINEGINAPVGKKINSAMNRVSIPGYSQHHTGLAIDYGGDTICLRKKAWPNSDFNTPNKWGFTLPYMSGGNIRMEEPWHLYYVGNTNTPNKPQINTQANQGQVNDKISITSKNLEELGKAITGQTLNQSLNLNSIKLDVDNYTFSVEKGDTPVFKLVLRYNASREKNCPSCENTISKNPEYGAQSLKKGTFQNGTRMYSLIVFYPKNG